MIGNSLKLRSKLEKKSTKELSGMLTGVDNNKYDDETQFLIRHIIQARGEALPQITVEAQSADTSVIEDDESEEINYDKIKKHYVKFVKNNPLLTDEEINNSNPKEILKVLVHSMALINSILLLVILYNFLSESDSGNFPHLFYILGGALAEYLFIKNLNLLQFFRWRGFIAANAICYSFFIIIYNLFIKNSGLSYYTEEEAVIRIILAFVTGCIFAFAGGWYWIIIRDDNYKTKAVMVYYYSKLSDTNDSD